MALAAALACALLAPSGTALAGTASLSAGEVAASPSATAPIAADQPAGSAPVWFPLRGDTRIGCTFNSPNSPCNGVYHPYWALDLEAPLDAAVYPAGGGTAHINSNEAECGPELPGRSIYVDHGDGTTSWYYHLNSITIEDGQEVDVNTVIGTVGNSGWVEPCEGFYHLHYEKHDSSGAYADPGPLNACHGADLVTYPQEFGIDSWEGFPAYEYTATNDGADCGDPQDIEEGSFVERADDSIFRIAGGAPIYVSSWDAVGGAQETIEVSDEEFAALAQQPADGAWLRGYATGNLYQTVGASALSVYDCTAYGFAADCSDMPAIDVDQAAIDHAGEDAPYDHLAAIPVDGTFMTGVPSGRNWEMSDGAVQRIGDPGEASVTVEDAAIADIPTVRPNLTMGNVRVVEGEKGTKRVEMTVRLGAIGTEDVTLQLKTKDGSARAGEDYRSGSFDVTIPQGERSAVVTVRVVGDRRSEKREEFYLDVQSASGAHVVDNRGRCRISDND